MVSPVPAPKTPVVGFNPVLPVRPPKKKGSAAPVVFLLLLLAAGAGVYFLAIDDDKKDRKEASGAPLPSANIVSPDEASAPLVPKVKPRPARTPGKQSKPTVTAAPTPATADPNEWRDPNVNLPAPKLPSGVANWLYIDGNQPKQSAADGTPPTYGPENATDGDTKDTDKVALATPSNGKAAWWSCSLKEPRPVSHIVIYGGGAESTQGKLTRFRVELTLDHPQNAKLARTFLKDGFALEGSEVWELKKPYKVKSVKITSLSKDAPLVIREIQLFGPNKS